MADENHTNANSDLAKITRERDYLQGRITSLEIELKEAKEIIEMLEEQKNENLQLKETIDRLRLDLDEIRTQARAQADLKNNSASSTLSRSASGRESIPITLSKSLGRELARRFADQDEDEESHETQERKKTGHEAEESYEEEIVTTRRRLVCLMLVSRIKRNPNMSLLTS